MKTVNFNNYSSKPWTVFAWSHQKDAPHIPRYGDNSVPGSPIYEVSSNHPDDDECKETGIDIFSWFKRTCATNEPQTTLHLFSYCDPCICFISLGIPTRTQFWVKSPRTSLILMNEQYTSIWFQYNSCSVSRRQLNWASPATWQLQESSTWYHKGFWPTSPFATVATPQPVGFAHISHREMDHHISLEGPRVQFPSRPPPSGAANVRIVLANNIYSAHITNYLGDHPLLYTPLCILSYHSRRHYQCSLFDRSGPVSCTFVCRQKRKDRYTTTASRGEWSTYCEAPLGHCAPWCVWLAKMCWTDYSICRKRLIGNMSVLPSLVISCGHITQNINRYVIKYQSIRNVKPRQTWQIKTTSIASTHALMCAWPKS